MSVESLIKAIDSELNLTELKMILDCVQIRMHEMKEVEVTVPRPKGRGFPLHQGHTDART